MRECTKYAISIVVGTFCSLIVQDALADAVSVSAQHSVVAASTDEDGRNWLTLNITLSNGSDQDLSAVRLLISPELSLNPGDELDALDVGSLPMDASVTMEWTFETMIVLSDGEALPGPLMFFGEATDAFDDFIAFPVNSTTGEE